MVGGKTSRASRKELSDSGGASQHAMKSDRWTAVISHEFWLILATSVVDW